MSNKKTQFDRLMIAAKTTKIKVLAEKLGVKPNRVSMWKARGEIPAGERIKASQLVGCSLDWLEHGTEDLAAEPVPYVAEGETCYLQGVLHLSDSEVRLITAYRQLDPNLQESILRQAEYTAIGLRESREREKAINDLKESSLRRKSNG